MLLCVGILPHVYDNDVRTRVRWRVHAWFIMNSVCDHDTRVAMTPRASVCRRCATIVDDVGVHIAVPTGIVLVPNYNRVGGALCDKYGV